MNKCSFAPNITRTGRWLRGLSGLVCLGGGLYLALAMDKAWGWLMVVAGLFMLFEAARGWCLARALGIKTPW